MSTLPLIAHRDLGAPLAWRDGVPIAAGRFLADVAQVAAMLPEGGHVLNVCADRYRFAVGLAAGLVAGKVSLLPSTHTAETVRQLRAFAADTFCLTDAEDCDIDLPQTRFPATDPSGWRDAVPQIPVDRLVACVFTSGSTGTPVPHRKRWGSLVANARGEARCLGMDDGRRHTLVGTVPPQHMYGFESTVLLALHSGGAFWAGRPFYPADIEAALAAVPRPRALVSTPFHLRTLLAAGGTTAADLVLSATAPLSGNLAREVETRLACPLYEIYGCTETGQIATRRTAEGAEWTLFDGVSLALRDARAWAFGGHVEEPTALGDVIEILPGGRFLLHGRSSDLVNIAGKRTSLGWLNHQLNAIPGVADGVFFMPDGDEADGVVRLAACVVAPDLDRRELLHALRERLDPVFLPRPLVMVEALPRNATGKLPRAALAQLIYGGRGPGHTDEAS